MTINIEANLNLEEKFKGYLREDVSQTSQRRYPQSCVCGFSWYYQRCHCRRLYFIRLFIDSTRNLCYIEHFNTIGLLTTIAFDAYWKKLDKDEKKVRFRSPLRRFYML